MNDTVCDLLNRSRIQSKAASHLINIWTKEYLLIETDSICSMINIVFNEHNVVAGIRKPSFCLTFYGDAVHLSV